MSKYISFSLVICFCLLTTLGCKKKIYTVPTLVTYKHNITPNALIDIAFGNGYATYSNATGYAITATEMFKSTNMGMDWKKLGLVDTNFTLTKLCVIDSFVVYITAHNYVYNRNLTFVTTDGGQTFKQMNAGAYDYHATEFISYSIGYMESVGIIYKTTDGGNSWLPTTFPAAWARTMDLIEFANISTGYAFSFATNKMYRTTDGGFTWQDKIYTSPTGLNNIRFSKGSSFTFIAHATGGDSQNGWYQTTDTANVFVGAKNIEIKDEVHPKMEFADLFFNCGFGVGDHNMYYTKDRGLNWEPRYTPRGESISNTFTGIWAVSDTKAFAITKEGDMINITLGNQ